MNMRHFFCLIAALSIFTLHATNTIQKTTAPQKIAVVGTGYVGLVSGCVLASIGHSVTCVDIDQEKIDLLNSERVPIYEPNLNEKIAHNIQEKKLSFSLNVAATIQNANIVIIAVGTPLDGAGQVNLSALKHAVKMVSTNMTDYKIICIKSTVPPGTNQEVKQTIKQYCLHENFDVVSNPEFLREGCAFVDFFEKNPIVLGGDSEKALDIMATVYKPLVDSGRTLIRVNAVTAELIKHAWNAFSFIKISYVNELSDICKKTNANIDDLIFGMSFSDELLPIRNIKPGPGIGGSCLPKDTKTFVSITEKIGADLEILKASIQSDLIHKQKILAEFYHLIGNAPAQKTIAILGLSFKPNTDDIRSGPAILIIAKLLADGAIIKAYDPKAMGQMRKMFPQNIYCNSSLQAISDADALILLTDWDEFKKLTPVQLGSLMRQKIVMDTRNMWDPAELEVTGFTFKNMGRL